MKTLFQECSVFYVQWDIALDISYCFAFYENCMGKSCSTTFQLFLDVDSQKLNHYFEIWSDFEENQ